MIWRAVLLSAVLTASIHQMKSETTLHNTDKYNADQYDVDIVTIHFGREAPPLNPEEADRKHYLLNILAHDEVITLNLIRAHPKLTGPKTRVYDVSLNAAGEEQIVKRDRAIEIMNTTIYEDYETKASVAIVRTGSTFGLIGLVDTLGAFFKPVPAEELVRMRRRRSLDNKDQSALHYLYRPKTSLKSRTRRSPESTNDDLFYEESSYRQPDPSDVLEQGTIPRNAKVLIMVDANYFKLFNSDTRYLIPYLMVMWNGVDMKYRTLNDVYYVTFNIAGFMIPRDGYNFPYITRHTVDFDVENRNKILFAKARKDMGKWLYKFAAEKGIIPIHSFNMAATITNYEGAFCALDGIVDGLSQFKCVPHVMGYAEEVPVCSINNDEDRSMSSTMLFTDEGRWSGLHHAAYTVGILWGLVPPLDETCTLRDDNIMTTPLSWNWSSCTKADSLSIFRYNDALCLRVEADVGN